MSQSPAPTPWTFWLSVFWLPALVCFFLGVGIAQSIFHFPSSVVFLATTRVIVIVNPAFIVAILAGIIRIVIESIQEIRHGRYGLDYIAFVAMAVSLVSSDFYLAGAVVALMFTGGKALETYASRKAYATLKSLGDTIPKSASVYRGGGGNGGNVEGVTGVDKVKKIAGVTEVALQDIHSGERILIKKNEIVPLDGVLDSSDQSSGKDTSSSVAGLFDLSNLTGEMEPAVFKQGTFIKSGTINIGDTVLLRVVGDFSTSTYHKIVKLVDDAKNHPARIVRVSEKANIYFTLITFIIAGATYFFGGGGGGGNIVRALAVLVIATPCPLIIAAPVAFIGGMSRVARSGIIVRKPVAFESIDRASTVFFDKTGTLTMGEPILSAIVSPSEPDDALRIAAGIEIHSLHPLARVIVHSAEAKKLSFPIADMITENIGQGISGTIDGVVYTMTRYVPSGQVADAHKGIVLVLKSRGKTGGSETGGGKTVGRNTETELARFYFTDSLKDGVADLFESLEKRHIHVGIITGDKKENAEEVFKEVLKRLNHTDVIIHADSSPEDKYHLVEKVHAAGEIVVMVGDGVNDAPALARADVGVVFSGTENGASIEASDVVILDHHIEKLVELFDASHRTLTIARQSIYGGIVLSCIGMAFAFFGYIPPVTGAIIQEVIDVAVIVNALRALGA